MGATIITITDMVKRLDSPPNRIREIRKAKGLTLRQVAEPLNTTQTQISRFETGERDLDVAWMRRIAGVLGTNPGQLLSPADNPDSLNADEKRVVNAMRTGEPHVARAVTQVAESLLGFDAGPDRDGAAPPARKRA